MPVDLGRAPLRDRADEVVELDRDRRGVDLRERKVVLRSLGAEELRRHAVEPKAPELAPQLARRSARARRASTTTGPPVRSSGTLIEPLRPCRLRWIHSRPGPDGM